MKRCQASRLTIACTQWHAAGDDRCYYHAKRAERLLEAAPPFGRALSR